MRPVPKGNSWISFPILHAGFTASSNFLFNNSWRCLEKRDLLHHSEFSFDTFIAPRSESATCLRHSQDDLQFRLPRIRFESFRVVRVNSAPPPRAADEDHILSAGASQWHTFRLVGSTTTHNIVGATSNKGKLPSILL